MTTRRIVETLDVVEHVSACLLPDLYTFLV